MTDRTEQEITDCWNRVGVRGDRSCGKLSVHTHCRHCEVYESSARAIMQRPLPEDYSRKWADYFSRPEPVPKELDRSALVFRIANEWLALPASTAVTAAETAASHKLPHRSGGALNGIVSVKGKLYPSMSLARLLSISEETTRQQPAKKRVYPRLLVVHLAQQAFALPVDDLVGIHRYAVSDLQAVPTTVNKSLHHTLTGVLIVEEMRVGMLDAELVGYKLASALK